MTGRLSLRLRLLATQVIVVASMGITVVVVAALIGPSEFHRHMEETGQAVEAILPHAEAAFLNAGGTAMAAGLVIGGLGAILASILLTRQITTSLAALAAGAQRVATGDYVTQVMLPPDADRELEGLARSFNSMAARIADTESTRRRMLTDLSHEMRTPLAAINVLLEGIEDGVVDADARTIETLRAQTARLTRLAADVRDVSAAEEGLLALLREPVTLTDLVASAVTTAQPGYAGRGVRLVVDGEVPEVMLEVDRGRIGQVLDNLLRNAVQHSPADSTVHIWSQVVAGSVRVAVRDEGAGISESDLPHIFERFYRGGTLRHDQGAGRGIGLAISRAIVAAHGGGLTATSEGPGRGAEFVLTLPI